MVNKDQPLTVAVGCGLLSISVGISTLCTALKGGPAFDLMVDGGGEPEITDEEVFVRAVAEELLRRGEDGTNRIHIMLHAAAEEAIDQGAEGFRFTGDA